MFSLKPSLTSTVSIRSTEIEDHFHIANPAAVERIKEYLEVSQEAPARVANPPPAGWPSSEGGIVVENLVIRYAADLPAVLKGITFAIKPREKIGVVRQLVISLNCFEVLIVPVQCPQVGRTGSGKVRYTSAGIWLQRSISIFRAHWLSPFCESLKRRKERSCKIETQPAVNN